MVILRTLGREMWVTMKYPLTLATFGLWILWLGYAMYRQAFMDQVLAGVLSALWLISLPAGLTLFFLMNRDVRFKARDLSRVARLSPGTHFFLRALAGFLVYYGLFAVLPSVIFERAVSLQPAETGAYTLLLAAPPLVLTVSAAAFFAAIGLGMLSIPALIVVFLAPLSLVFVGMFGATAASLFFPLGKIHGGTFSIGYRDPGAVFQAAAAAVLVCAYLGLGLVSAAIVSRRRAGWIAAAILCLGVAAWQGYSVVQSFDRVGNPRFFLGLGFDFSVLNQGKTKECELRDQTLSIQPSGRDRAMVSAAFRIVMNDSKKCTVELPASAESPAVTVNGQTVEMKQARSQSRGPIRAEDHYTLEYPGPDAGMKASYVLPAFQLTSFSSIGMGPLYSMGFGGQLLRISVQSIAPGTGSRVPQVARPTHLEVQGVNPAHIASDGDCAVKTGELTCDFAGKNPGVFEYTPQQSVAESERVSFSVKTEHSAPFLKRQERWKKTVDSLDQCLGAMGVTAHTQLLEADWVTFQSLKGAGFVGPEALMEWVGADDATVQIGFSSAAINALFGTRTFGGGSPPTMTDEIALITAYICGREKAGFSDDSLRESLRQMDSKWNVRINLQTNPMFKERRKNFYDLLSAYKERPQPFKQRLAAVVADILVRGERSMYAFNLPGTEQDNYVAYLEFNADTITHEVAKLPDISGGGRRVRFQVGG